MVKIIKGDILNCTNVIIVHQVNCQGSMGGGLARQIAEKYPNTEQEYIKYCQEYEFNYEELRGNVLITEEDTLLIANIFSQKPNFDTDYEAIKEAFKTVRGIAKLMCKKVLIPYKIGCGIAKGDFDKVLDIILEVFKDGNCTIYKL